MGDYLSLRTIADLRNASLIAPIFVLGTATPGDGGGGTYVYIITESPPPDDGVTVIVPTHPREPGYWLRCSSNSGGGSSSKVVRKTANYTVTTQDSTILADCSGGGFTLTLPLASGMGTGYGQVIRIKRVDTSVNLLALALSGGDTIETSPSILGSECWEFTADSVSKWWAMALYQP
jgi:hypothetical protein